MSKISYNEDEVTKPFIKNEPSSDLEWLAIAQHHGLPTRLLDWTENALNALYFATEKPPQEDQTHAVVWVISFDRDCKFLSIGPELKFIKPVNIIPRISSQMGWLSIRPCDDSDFYERAENAKTVRQRSAD